jgi:hypothetical protein
MIVTDFNQGWDKKVNFTDSNDVFVGFDMSVDCCENFGWYVSKEIDISENYEEVHNFDGYVFDTLFFEYRETDDQLEDENYAIFRLVKEGCGDLFLHLYNHHNGYYSHGFEAKVKGRPWQIGFL